MADLAPTTTLEQSLLDLPHLDYLDGLIPKSGHLEFDFRDPKQYEFAADVVRKCFQPERYPGRLKALERQKADQERHGFVSALAVDPSGFQTSFAIPGLGFAAGQSGVASNGIGTVAGGYASLSLLLFIRDNATGKIIAAGTNNQLVGTFLPVSTTAGTPSAPGLNVTAYLQYNYTPQGGGTPKSGIVKQGAYNAVDPVLIQPVPYCTAPWVPGAINIGLGRLWGDPELGVRFDYIWAETTQGNPKGKIPFVGSVIFNQAIQALAPSTNFLLQIYVANDTGGGTVTLSPTDLAQVYNCFSIDAANPAKLNWNLPAGLNAQDPGNPITFGQITWPSDMMAYFYCQIIVTLADGSFGSANVQSQTTQDDNPLDGTLGIKPISFVWHCLAEDTLVTLENGTRKPLGEVVGGDRVRAHGTGKAYTVGFTTRGAHHGRALRITATGERSIVTSSHHVFATHQGFTPAASLQIGDQVAMDDGWSRVTALEWLEYHTGIFCNLALTDERGLLQEQALEGFIANGFKVGDLGAQRRHREALRHTKAWVRQQVPDFHLEDVEAYFADLAAPGSER